MDTQLLPEFDTSGNAQVGFDLTKVRVLQTDEDALQARARGGLTSGLYTRNQALVMVGMDPEGPESDILYIPTNVTPTLPADLNAPPEPAPLPPGAPDVPPLTAGQKAELLPADRVPALTAGHTNGHAQAQH